LLLGVLFIGTLGNQKSRI